MYRTMKDRTISWFTQLNSYLTSLEGRSLPTSSLDSVSATSSLHQDNQVTKLCSHYYNTGDTLNKFDIIFLAVTYWGFTKKIDINVFLFQYYLVWIGLYTMDWFCFEDCTNEHKLTMWIVLSIRSLVFKILSQFA